MSNRTRTLTPRVGLVLLALAAAEIGGARRGEAQSADPWVGAKVMARASGTRLKVGARVSATLNAGSVFRVERVNGDWLWVDSGNIRGWVKKADIVGFDQAIAYFTEAAGRNPADAYAFVSRGIAFHARKDDDKAVADFTEAIRLDPKNDWSFHDRAVAHHARGEYNLALADANEAIRLNPSEAAHVANRASTEFALKAFDRASADYSEAIRLLRGDEASLDDADEEGEPGQSRGRLWAAKWTCARAECWAARHAPEKAIADYAEALRIDPQDAASLNSLAWLLATCTDDKLRDGRRAFDLAARACVLTGYHNHLCLDTLAAAYAESGDFDNAVKWLGSALELASGDPRTAEHYKARLKLFREKTPYRDEAAP